MSRDGPLNVFQVDPSAYTPPYDHALAEALVRAGASVHLVTSSFVFGEAPQPDGYRRHEMFYRRVWGPPGSPVRRGMKLAAHVPDMVRLSHAAQRWADVVHFQWLVVPWLDLHLLPRRPLVVTAHDVLPRLSRPGQRRAQLKSYERADAIVAHSGYGRDMLVRHGIPAAKVQVIPHGAFDHLTRLPAPEPLQPEFAAVSDPVVLFFGLIRPYKGLLTLLEAWRGICDAELWIVGRPLMPLDELRAEAPERVRFVPRFVADAELPAYFERADVVVLPYARTETQDSSGVMAIAFAFGRATIVSDVGGLAEMAGDAAVLVEPENAGALNRAILSLLTDPSRRQELSAAARIAADGRLSWDRAAALTVDLYRRLAPG